MIFFEISENKAIRKIMIHQHIFAAPKPGMTESDFQDYWINLHAPRYAMKIPQIAKYRLNLRLSCSVDPAPIWSGCAEIWLRNDAEQIASMQTPEFLQGARLDEPNWAAFWMTAVLDCETETLLDGTVPDGAVKLIVMSKRDLAHDVTDYRILRRADLKEHAESVPGLLRVDMASARDGLYAVGEARFDEVAHFWFASVEAAERAFAAPERDVMLPSTAARGLNPAQVFPMLVQPHWLIGPEERPLAGAA
ncbi:EthD domain-containing protein [Roseicyclus mahoneyensis]|jgi:hypothetical protein|uniref:EthD domain-containing protein n=1 Tax=Roseicyclus mahoneyensis TaxID=164332 RepID=A0A316GG92_9RHOB|nr:EthD domain-containing protein [Roseicyclus mahoneyensis]PWK59215.1 EthD domain-containing protein [Roseicyclus mahoneyensis]